MPRRNLRAAWVVVLVLLASTLAPWSSLLGPRSVRAAEVLTNQNVIAMARSGLPESLILAKIQWTDAQFDLSSRGLIALKQGGVSDNVIMAMMNRATSGASPPPAASGSYSPSPPPAFPASAAPPGQSVPGCPQLSQPDPYQDVRSLVAQLRAQAGQPGVASQPQVQPLAGQIQTALDGRDAALRRGACDTSQYEQQIGSSVASLQSALAASAQAAAPPSAGYGAPPPPAYGYPQQAPPPAYGSPQQAPPPPPVYGYPQEAPPPPPGYPQQAGGAGAPPGAPYQAAPGAPGALPSAGEVFSKLFDIAIDKLSKKSKKGGDSGSGFSSGNQPPPQYSDPSTQQPSYSGAGGYQGTPNPSNPSGYSPPPSGYTPPPSGYTPPPSGYTPPPSGYTPPPSGYTQPPIYAPPPQPSQQMAPPSSSGLSSLPALPGSTSTQRLAPSPSILPTLQQARDLAQVTGIVRSDSGAPLVGATVSAVEWNTAVITGADGTYVLQGPARQSVTIRVQAFDYLTQTSVTPAPAGAVTTKHIALVWARRPLGGFGR